MVEGTALAPFLLIVCACGVVRDSSTPLRFGRNDIGDEGLPVYIIMNYEL